MGYTLRLNYQVDDGIGAPALVGEDLEVSAEVPGVQPRQGQAVAVASEGNGASGQRDCAKVLK
jgi:hypothetical protein